MSEVKSKVCTKCNQEKDFSEYYTKTWKNKTVRASECKECSKKQSKKNYTVERDRKSKLKVKYNLTETDYLNLFLKQEGRCSICGIKLLPWGSKTNKQQIAHIDHDHETSKVRGLLCSPCNTGLGMFKDSITTLWNAIKYLENHEK